MGAQLGTTAPDREGAPVGQRVIKILIALAFAGAGYYFFSDVLGAVFNSTHDSKLQQDFQESAKAIERYELDTGKKYRSSELDGLSKQLATIPKDPEGHSYVYD